MRFRRAYARIVESIYTDDPTDGPVIRELNLLYRLTYRSYMNNKKSLIVAHIALRHPLSEIREATVSSQYMP